MIESPLLKSIEKGMHAVEMSLQDDSWRNDLPAAPGWYFIETNTPPEVFKNVGPPKGERHYNIPEKVNSSLSLKSFDACILPLNNHFYFVYSGETKTLKLEQESMYLGIRKLDALPSKTTLHYTNISGDFILHLVISVMARMRAR